MFHIYYLLTIFFIFNEECYENLTNKMRSRETFRNGKINSLINSVTIYYLSAMALYHPILAFSKILPRF